MDKLLPGQLTAVFDRKETLNPNLNPGTKLIGVRIPNHYFVRELLRCCPSPIALTSANKSGQRSTLEIKVHHYTILKMTNMEYIMSAFFCSHTSNIIISTIDL